MTLVLLVTAVVFCMTIGAPVGRAAPGYTIHPAVKYRTFHIHGSHGTDISVFANERGLVEVFVLQLRRWGLVEYVARGSTANDHVRARFRGLGHVDMRWKPTAEPEVTSEPQGDCRGRKAMIQPGFFVGSFSFRGEDGYTEGKATKVSGLAVHSFREVCKGSDAGPESAAPPEEALLAYEKDARRELEFRASARAARGGRIEEFQAALTEHRPNLTIRRVTFGGAEPAPGQFTFDHAAGSASVAPPDPFLGSAELNATSNEPWSGDLTVPFLGAGRMALAGPGFRASLTQRVGGIPPLSN